MEQTAQSSKKTILILISRFSLVLIYFYLGIKHLVNPESFRATIALPETGSNILREIFALPLANETSFTLFRYFAVSLELLMGFMLLIGFLLRLCGVVSSSLTFLLGISLIPNVFLFILQ